MTGFAPRRPLLRYHGGKWKLAEWIIEHFPPHRAYVEPFGGGGSVLLRKPRAYAEVYNDLDGEVVNCFRVMRDPKKASKLRTRLLLTPFARAEFNLGYQPAREEIERARRLIIRSFMGFGSSVTRPNRDGRPQRTGFRCNSNRSGTTPAHDWANYPAEVERFVERLRGVVIENRDAVEVMQQHDSAETLHYVDPPYPHSTRAPSAGGSHRGYRHEMTDEQHEQLAHELHQLKGKVVLSTYPSALYERLYPTWSTVQCHSIAHGAAPRQEVLYLNPACALAQRQQQLPIGSAA